MQVVPFTCSVGFIKRKISNTTETLELYFEKMRKILTVSEQ